MIAKKFSFWSCEYATNPYSYRQGEGVEESKLYSEETKQVLLPPSH